MTVPSAQAGCGALTHCQQRTGWDAVVSQGAGRGEEGVGGPSLWFWVGPAEELALVLPALGGSHLGDGPLLP